MRTEKKIQYVGYWGTSEEGIRTAGALSVDERGFYSLRVFAQATDSSHQKLIHYVGHGPVLGICDTGKHITIQRVSPAGIGTVIRGPHSQRNATFNAGLVLVGSKFAPQKLIKSIEFTVSHIENIFFRSLVEMDLTNRPSAKNRRTPNAVLILPNKFNICRVKLTNNLSLQVRWHPSFAYPSPSGGTIDTPIRVRLSFPKGETIENSLQHTKTFSDFISLVTLGPSIRSDFSVSFGEPKNDRETVEYNLLFKSGDAEYDDTALHENPGIISIANGNKEIARAIRKWFCSPNEVKTAWRLITNHFTTFNQYSINRFLDSARALELIAKSGATSSTKLSPSLKADIKSLLDQHEAEDADKLIEALDFAHQGSFRQLLKRYTSSLGDDLRSLVFESNEEKKRFIEQVVTLRNFYTHYSESNRKRASDINAMILCDLIVLLIASAQISMLGGNASEHFKLHHRRGHIALSARPGWSKIEPDS